MTFTADNWHRFNPPNFAMTAPGAVIEPYTCALHLRQYDVTALTALLTERGIAAQPPNERRRYQGRAAKKRWWGDGDAVIPRALLVLCAITQELKPAAALPDPCHHCGDTGRITYKDTQGRTRQALCPSGTCAVAAAHARGGPLPDFGVGFPFRPKDGLRGEPRSLLKYGEDLVMRQLQCHLPLVIRERLEECGRNYHDQGKLGVADPTGKFYSVNRSAAVRRLLEAVRLASLAGSREAGALPEGVADAVSRVRLDAPIHFRGVELFKPGCTSADVHKNPRHFLESEAQMWEARARRLAADSPSEVQRVFNAQQAASRVRDLVTRYDRNGQYSVKRTDRRYSEALTDTTSAGSGRANLQNIPRAGLLVIDEVAPVPSRMYEATSAVAAAANRKQPRRGKLRPADVTEFDPDKLG